MPKPTSPSETVWFGKPWMRTDCRRVLARACETVWFGKPWVRTDCRYFIRSIRDRYYTLLRTVQPVAHACTTCFLILKSAPAYYSFLMRRFLNAAPKLYHSRGKHFGEDKQNSETKKSKTLEKSKTLKHFARRAKSVSKQCIHVWAFGSFASIGVSAGRRPGEFLRARQNSFAASAKLFRRHQKLGASLNSTARRGESIVHVWWGVLVSAAPIGACARRRPGEFSRAHKNISKQFCRVGKTISAASETLY